MPEIYTLPATVDALIIIALIVSPGYVFMQMARLVNVHTDNPTDLRLLLAVIPAGLAIQTLFFPILTYRLLPYYGDGTLVEHQARVLWWIVIVCFLAPLVLGVIAGKLVSWGPVDSALSWIGFGTVARMPSAWEYAIRQQRSCYVRAHLKNGKAVGGVFGTDSFASTDPRRLDLYLEKAWQLNDSGEFLKEFSGTSGSGFSTRP